MVSKISVGLFTAGVLALGLSSAAMADAKASIEARQSRKTPFPEFRVGDTVKVHVLIKEGEKVKVHTETGEFAGRA